MKQKQLLEHFVSLAKRLGLRIVQGKGDFYGGSCILKQDKVIVLNKLKPIEQRLRVLAREFADIDLTGVYIVPVLREYINEKGMDLFEMGQVEKP